jgi:hypothetical protein
VSNGFHRRPRFRPRVLRDLRHRFRVVADRGDRASELAGDVLDRAVELLGQRRHLRAALRRLLLFGLSSRLLDLLYFQGVAAEYLDGLDHASDFIGALAVAQRNRGVAG